MFTVKKEFIAIGTDHTDQGNKIRNAIIEYLESQSRKVKAFDHQSEEDSYVKIAEAVCKEVTYGQFREGFPDSAILIDQFGSAMSSVANLFYKIIASVAWDPKVAYEITRKNNPNVLCLSTQAVNNGDLVKISPEFAVSIVDTWLKTDFLQNILEDQHEKYIKRQLQSERIHIMALGATLSVLRTGPGRSLGLNIRR